MDKILYEKIIKDISSFADDENDVWVSKKGQVSFERNNVIIEVEICPKRDGSVWIKNNGIEKPYKNFIAEDLADLKTLAERILKQRTISNIYIDPVAILYEDRKKNQGTALTLLKSECDNPMPVCTKIDFVTADAGHGKTMLLQKFQYDQAERYKRGETDYLFFHINLHGRDLIRLNEAIMYELGELRFSGLFYSSVITLIRNNLIILGIDGFDELAAEIGGETALSSLKDLVIKMNGDGILVAASRRTFFSTQDYIEKTKLLGNVVEEASAQFNEIKLSNWGEVQCIEYLENYPWDAQVEYNKMLNAIGSASNHPLLERPYLFTKIINVSYEENISPNEFIMRGDTASKGVNGVIEAFVHREVEKWKDTDKETGKPYLTFDQHMYVLGEIAGEMWNNQTDTLSIEIVQFLLTICIESWEIDPKLQPRIIRMVESHALLIPVDKNSPKRRFDHEEFKNFFLSRYFENLIRDTLIPGNDIKLYNFLSKGPLPDSVASYYAHRVETNKKIEVVKLLISLKNKDWKPTYIQANIGTILPYLLDEVKPSEPIEIDGKITFSSLIFENKNLTNLLFKNCSFINLSFKNTSLHDVRFVDCNFSDLRFYTQSNNRFENVTIIPPSNVQVATRIIDDGEGEERLSEYSPYNIVQMLKEEGISTTLEKNSLDIPLIKNTPYRKFVKRFLNKFNKMTIQYEKNFQGDPIYSAINSQIITEEILPLLKKYDIVKEKETKNTQNVCTRGWALKDYDLQEIFKAEENPDSPLYKFWLEVNNHE